MELAFMVEMKNKSPKILVVGDLIIDHYLWGISDRISPEAPVPVVKVEKESTNLGGAGNVINNLQALGAKVDILSVLGDCENSLIMLKMLKKAKIKSDYLIVQKGRIASKKTRIIVSKQQVIRYDSESTEEINNKSQNSLISIFNKIVSSYEIVLISDYGKGILTNKVTKALIENANQYKKRVLIDPKGLDYSKYKGAFLITPNKKEASEASNIYIKDKDSLKKAIFKLKKQLKLEFSIITLSEQGVAVYDNKLRIHPTIAKEVFDVTGAGDTILASLGYALSCKLDIDESIKFANLAAGIVVGKIGSASTTLNEIIEYKSNINKTSSNDCIKTKSEISSLVSNFKKNDQKIVFSNGCFDLIHSGHIKYLETAKSYGDILIIGLNSDRSVKALKGENRPITCQEDRGLILAALEAVDYVVIFDEDTPYNLIKIIQPDTLVKGGDYLAKDVVGSDIAKELILVEFVKNKSSTETINKIQKGL
jgi:D-beta-D-heptose 7-phosphate kinase / D-beta-D-heptose 1-phosphate adenosyltransferase